MLYNYFNIPFLELKVKELQAELQRCKSDLGTAREEVDCYIDNLDYAMHKEMLNLARYVVSNPCAKQDGHHCVEPSCRP